MNIFDELYKIKNWFIPAVVVLSIIISYSFCHAQVCPAINQDLAIKGILGEASNQGYKGMLAVACAIRNRGTLQGVYGVKAKHIYKEPKWVWNMAKKAWQESQYKDITNGATHWENNKAFGVPYWAKFMKIVVVIGEHTFYK